MPRHITEEQIESEDIRRLFSVTRESAFSNQAILEHVNARHPALKISGEEIARFFELFCIGADDCYKNEGRMTWSNGLEVTPQVSFHDGTRTKHLLGYVSPPEDRVIITTDSLKYFIQRLRQTEQYVPPDTVFRPLKNMSAEEEVILIGLEENFHASQYNRPEGLGYKETTPPSVSINNLQHWLESQAEIEASYAIARGIRRLGLKAEIGEPYKSGSFDTHPYKTISIEKRGEPEPEKPNLLKTIGSRVKNFISTFGKKEQAEQSELLNPSSKQQRPKTSRQISAQQNPENFAPPGTDAALPTSPQAPANGINKNTRPTFMPK